jgi:hypothetical protein
MIHRLSRSNDSGWMSGLASEVTPGLLAGAEPNAHHFYVMIILMG